jgi:endothelin-converting enzyme
MLFSITVITILVDRLQTLDITDPNFLLDYYKNVDVKCSGYFVNVVAMRELKFHKTWDALGKPVDRDQW